MQPSLRPQVLIEIRVKLDFHWSAAIGGGCMSADRDADLILIVEDDPVVRIDLSATLTEHGYRIAQAADGREALELTRDAHPQLVLTDIYMGYVDGLQFIRSLRQSRVTTPVIAMSGHDLRDDVLKIAQRIGADAVLAKPIQVFELIEVVSELLCKPR